MFITAVTTAGVASAVWASGTRTLTNPTGVWSDATRNLTSFGAFALLLPQVVHTSIANGTNVDLRPSGTRGRMLSLVLEGTANVQYTVGLYDGSTFRTGALFGSTVGVSQVMAGNSSFGQSIGNTGTASGFYNVAGYDFVQ